MSSDKHISQNFLIQSLTHFNSKVCSKHGKNRWSKSELVDLAVKILNLPLQTAKKMNIPILCSLLTEKFNTLSPSLPPPFTRSSSVSNSSKTSLSRESSGGSLKSADQIESPVLMYTPMGDNSNEHDINLYLNDVIHNCDPNRESIKSSNVRWNTQIKPYLSKMCDVLPIASVDVILGPSSYTEFKFLDKQIGIFGEIHDLRVKSSFIDSTARRILTFSSFIKSLLLTNQTKIYDLYLEVDYINKNIPRQKRIPEENFSLHLVDREFEKCIQVDKSLCNYKNIRIHYIDIRDYLDEYVGWGDRVYENAYTVLRAYLELPKFSKQLDQNKYAGLIIHFFENEINKIIYLYRNSPDKYCKSKNLFKEYIKSLAVDFYLLSRLTKDSSFYQKNIFTYTGEFHSVTYIRFFSFVHASLQNFNYHPLFDSHVNDTKRFCIPKPHDIQPSEYQDKLPSYVDFRNLDKSSFPLIFS